MITESFIYPFKYLCFMPTEKKYKLRYNGKKRLNVAELTIPPEWRRYHKIEIGTELTTLANNVLVILPPGLSEEDEKRVRDFVEGKNK